MGGSEGGGGVRRNGEEDGGWKKNMKVEECDGMIRSEGRGGREEKREVGRWEGVEKGKRGEEGEVREGEEKEESEMVGEGGG